MLPYILSILIHIHTVGWLVQHHLLYINVCIPVLLWVHSTMIPWIETNNLQSSRSSLFNYWTTITHYQPQSTFNNHNQTFRNHHNDQPLISTRPNHLRKYDQPRFQPSPRGGCLWDAHHPWPQESRTADPSDTSCDDLQMSNPYLSCWFMVEGIIAA